MLARSGSQSHPPLINPRSANGFLLSSVFLIAGLYFLICMFYCLFHLLYRCYTQCFSLLYVRLFRVFSTNTHKLNIFGSRGNRRSQRNCEFHTICKIVHSTTMLTLMKDQRQTDHFSLQWPRLLAAFQSTHRLPRHAARLAELARS